MGGIETNLGTLRRRRGLSAISLSKAVGVTRQTIYAMEARSYIPNTAVALRLAQVLECTVEELFTLGGDPAAHTMQTARVNLLAPGAHLPEPGQAVQLCRVDKKLIASLPSPFPCYFPPSDAVLTGGLQKNGRTHVQVFQEDSGFTDRILVAGCDPGISILSRHQHAAGPELVLAHCNSSQSLALLKTGCIHIAGTHLRDEVSGESNLPEIERLFPKNSVAVISFAVWEQGILTARGNPKAIQGIADFPRGDISIVNREKGAGSRALLDAGLKRERVASRSVRGYSGLAYGHLEAAAQVASGAVDACLATRAAARRFGLHFIPLISERYDFVLRRQHLALPRIQNLLDTLSRSGFRRELEALGGYDTRVAGQRIL